MKYCAWCQEVLEGRSDKKFCSPYCKTAYHNQKNVEKEKGSLFYKIDSRLKRNRKLLMKYNLAGKATVEQQVLLKQGFCPKYFTHYWRAKNKNLYLFCYEFGYMEKAENGKKKYILVQWQSYMS
jgi:hypothetical protein